MVMFVLSTAAPQKITRTKVRNNSLQQQIVSLFFSLKQNL